MANDGSLESGAERTRQEKTKRLYYNAAGEASPRVKLDSVRAELRFVGSDEVLVLNYTDLTPEVARAAALHGVLSTMTDPLGKKGLTVDDMVQISRTRLETIVEDKQWVSGTRTGHRSGDILEAIKRYHEEHGKPWDEQLRTHFTNRLNSETDGEAVRATILNNPRINAHVEAIKAERAAAKAKAASDAAQRAPDVLDLMTI